MPHSSSPAHHSPGDADALALTALAWLLTDEARRERLLALTGLTPDDLRDRLTDRAVLAAVLEYLTGHEPDLVAAADALNVAPERLVAAQAELAA